MNKVTYNKTGYITFVWVNYVRIGEIYRMNGYRKKAACPTCGHSESERITTGYSLRIYDRCWRHGKLMPKGRGGSSALGFKRLHEAKAKAEALFG